MELDSLLSAAARAEKCDNFQDEGFAEPLKVLLASIENEAGLHFFGRIITRTRLINLLRNRLRIAKLLTTHPEIEETSLPPVILITGLQRTGTTLLHRLLGADPGNRALLSWEALNPAPFLMDLTTDQRKKLKIARRAEKALRFLARDFFAIHPVEANAPEEDVLLLDYSFISTVAESTLYVPTYARWVEQNDNTPAYEYMRTLLKVLSWRRPGLTWILKSPHHLEFLNEFLTVFEDATVVMTHRDPLTTLPSFCSMMWHGRGIFSDVVDPKQIGDQWLRKTARMLELGLKTRSAREDHRFLDIYYEALLEDPIAEARRIYEVADLALESEALAQMARARKENVQHKYGVHRYAMEPFGLTAELIRERYANYLSRYFPGAAR